MTSSRRSHDKRPSHVPAYSGLVTGISDLLDSARRTSARAVNSILTATYWEIGRRIVEYEQAGERRAEYGRALLSRLAADLSARHGRGFSARSLWKMRAFYVGWQIRQSPSAESEGRAILPTASAESEFSKTPQTPHPGSSKMESPARQEDTVDPVGTADRSQGFSPAILPTVFPLAWSHYVRLLSVPNPRARAFYEAEGIRGGWSVRQLDRQIQTQFFERTSRSKRPDAMLAPAGRPMPDEIPRPEDEIRDPYLLEFLDLKDEYGESDLEEALVCHLEWFLLELGSGFTFVARQKRIRVGDSWFRIDLVLSKLPDGPIQFRLRREAAAATRHRRVMPAWRRLDGLGGMTYYHTRR